MRLIYLFKSFAQRAGTERILSDKMNYLVRELGYDITFVTYEQGTHPLAFELDSRIKVIDLDTRFFTLHRIQSPFRRLYAYFAMRRKFRQRLQSITEEVKPDWFISTTYSFPLMDCILSLPTRHIIESHICLQEVVGFTQGRKTVWDYLKGMRTQRLFRAMRRAQVLVALTQADAEEWQRHTGVSTQVIPNTLHSFPHTITPSDNRPQRIVCAGRLHRQKGYDLLIEAWSRIAPRHPAWRIDIYGQGEEEDALKRDIHEHNLQGQMALHAPTAYIYKEYQSSAFLVLSSRYEGFGLVLIEAMSCGTPCVSFDCPHGPSDIIAQGEEGLLVPQGNVDELARALEWMIEHPEERSSMGEKARKKAQRYLPEHVMPLWTHLFEQGR